MLKSVQWKIVLLYSLLILFAMQLIGVYTIQSLERYYLNNYFANMEAQGELVASFVSGRLLEEDGEAYIADLLQEFDAYSGLEIMVLDRFGRVIGDFAENGYWQSRRVIQEEVSRALAGNRSEALRFNPEDQQRYYYLALPIKAEQTVVGVIYLNGSLEQIDTILNQVKMIHLTGSALVLGVAIVVGMVLARTITAPIQEVTNKAAKMASGDFTQRINVQAEDEIGQLGKMFNHLTLRLSETLEQISAEKNKVETILNYMSDGIIAFNKKGELIHLNPAAKRLLPSSEGDDTPPKDVSILKPFFPEEELAELLNIDKPITREISIRSGREKTKSLQVHFVPLAEKASFSGILVAIHDITQERELIHLQQEFVANVSHELRTPLTTVKSYVETLLDGAMEQPKLLVKFLNVVEAETERMVNLVRNLLVLSQFDSYHVSWKKEQVDMNSLVCEVIDQFSLKIKERKLIVENHLKNAQIPKLIVDRDRIKQVWINIIGNALKYTPPGGKIKLGAFLKDEGKVSFYIKDTGIGIPTEEQERVFERFYRVDKGRSRQRGGTGLGLSIAKEIIKAHSGEIWLESSPGEGTTVSFTLPHMEREGGDLRCSSA
ncbi:MAG: cell wall metabolism sensor histidine kinase WalK [Firmicutes bacterium]|nr:cell wall metabolism sensor histidine kinase WalK [Bacillota bacterium]